MADTHEIAGIQVPYAGEELGVYIPDEENEGLFRYATIDLEELRSLADSEGKGGLSEFVDITLQLAQHSVRGHILETRLGAGGRSGIPGVEEHRAEIANTLRIFNYIKRELDQPTG